jgi:hypothetical protein
MEIQSFRNVTHKGLVILSVFAKDLASNPGKILREYAQNDILR